MSSVHKVGRHLLHTYFNSIAFVAHYIFHPPAFYLLNVINDLYSVRFILLIIAK